MACRCDRTCARQAHEAAHVTRITTKPSLAAAKARGVALSRQVGQRPSDKKAKKVLAMHRDGLSYRLIGRNVGLSKNTVMEVVKRGLRAGRQGRQKPKREMGEPR